MTTTTLKTMHYILAEVQEFCHNNLDRLYQHSVSVQHFLTGDLLIDVNITEQFSEPIKEQHFQFYSKNDGALDAVFDAFREYTSDYEKRNR